MTVGTLMTADELLQLPNDGWRYELIRGELLKMSPSGARHGEVAAQVIASLVAFCNANRIGKVYSSETGFRIARNPDTVRAPDAGFVSAERLKRTNKFFEGAPDATFEVISPSDSYSEVEGKTREWLRAGVNAVVTIDPETELVRIHRADSTITVNDVLAVEDVIPGWRLPLAQLFA